MNLSLLILIPLITAVAVLLMRYKATGKMGISHWRYHTDYIFAFFVCLLSK